MMRINIAQTSKKRTGRSHVCRYPGAQVIVVHVRLSLGVYDLVSAAYRRRLSARMSCGKLYIRLPPTPAIVSSTPNNFSLSQAGSKTCRKYMTGPIAVRRLKTRTQSRELGWTNGLMRRNAQTEKTKTAATYSESSPSTTN